MDLELNGKVALITGGSKGIGKAIALELAREGVDIAIAARSQGPLDETAEELRATGRRVVAVAADMMKGDDVQNMVDTTVAQLGRVDILVNNAAMVGGQVRGTLAEATEKGHDRGPGHQGGGLFPLHEGCRAPYAAPGLGPHHQHWRRLGAPVHHLRPAQRRSGAHDQDLLRPTRPPTASHSTSCIPA